MSRESNVRCSFCGKRQDQVGRLIAGPNVYICDECVRLCGSIIADGALSVYTVNGEQVENANLKSGLYVVRVVKDGNAMTKKVLVK